MSSLCEHFEVLISAPPNCIFCKFFARKTSSHAFNITQDMTTFLLSNGISGNMLICLHPHLHWPAADTSLPYHEAMTNPNIEVVSYYGCMFKAQLETYKK